MTNGTRDAGLGSDRKRGQQLVVNAAESAVAHDHDLVTCARLCGDLGDDVLDPVEDARFFCDRRQRLFRIPAQIAAVAPDAIGLGETGNLGGESLADAGGPAFELSGKALEDMGRTHWLGLAGPAVTTSDAIITRLIEERARRWSPQQAEAVALALDPDNPTLADLATHLGISPQAVSYRLNGAGASAIRRALRDWEEEFEMQRLSALAPHLP